MLRGSIRKQVLGVLLCFALLFAGAFEFLWMPKITQILLESQQDEIANQLDSVMEGVTPFVLSNQYAAVHETLNAVAERNTNWEIISLVRGDGLRIYPVGALGVPSGQHLLSVQSDLIIEGGLWGTISAVVVMDGPVQELRSVLMVFAATSLATILWLFLLVGYLFDKFVTRRLLLLSLAAAKLGRGQYDARLPEAGNNEVGRLVRAFDVMRRQILDNTEKLQAARQEAENALEAKTRFLSSMSHEIRTPLNGIIPVAEMLRQSPLSKDQEKGVQTIQRAGKALLNIVDDILDLNKLQEGKVVLRNDPFCLKDVIEEVADLMRIAASNRGLALATEYNIDHGQILVGDEGRLRQMLLNLVGNAIKFTEHGSVRIVCGKILDTPESMQIFIDVVDTGIGIPEEDQERIFDRFEQAEGGWNRRFEGTGLGLPITKGLVHAMGGDLAVTSVYGQGSTFRLSLTLAKQPAGQQAIPSIGKSMASTALSHGDPNTDLNILLVDDNFINLEIAREMLKKLGHRVTTAENGIDALNLVGTGDFDIVFMDVQMPVMDGLEATRKIRDLSGDVANITVIALTAGVMEENREICSEAGMNDFLTKPLRLEDFQKTIQKWTKSPRGQRDDSAA